MAAAWLAMPLATDLRASGSRPRSVSSPVSAGPSVVAGLRNDPVDVCHADQLICRASGPLGYGVRVQATGVPFMVAVQLVGFGWLGDESEKPNVVDAPRASVPFHAALPRVTRPPV